MVEPLLEIAASLRLLIFISALVLGWLLINKFRYTMVSTTGFASIILISTGLISGLEAFVMLVSSQSVDLIGTYVSILDGILGIIIAFFLILIISHFEENSINPTKIGILSSLSTLTIITLLIVVIPDAPEVFRYTSFSFIFLFVYVVVSLRNSLIRISSKMQKNQTPVLNDLKNYIYWVLGDVVIIYAITTFVFLSGVTSVESVVYQINVVISLILPTIIFLLGNVYFYRVFVRPDNPAMLLPQTQDKLILMTRQGIPFFEYNFRHTEKIDGILVSGAITAITAVLKEATQHAGDLKQVQLGSQILRVEAREEIIGVIFTDQPTTMQSEFLGSLMNKLKGLPDLNFSEISIEQDNLLSDYVEYYFGLRPELPV